MEQFAPILRGIAEKIGLESVKDLIKQPIIKTVFRVTMYYQDFRASHSVATLTRTLQAESPLAVNFYNRFDNKPIVRQLPLKAYNAFVHDFNQARFDKLSDQNTSPYGKDLCMIEYSTGGFVHSVIFAPAEANDEYDTLYTAIKTHIPEALREVK